MSNWKAAAKRAASSLFSVCSIYTFAEKIHLSNKSFILMYHRVVRDVDSEPYRVQPAMYVTALTFEKHLSFLKSRFRVLFLEDLVEKVQKGENIERCCAITFDDGWLDNYTEAFPILKKHGLPATIFLATGYIGTDRVFWPDELSYYLGRIGPDCLPPHGSSELFVRFCKTINGYDRSVFDQFVHQCVELMKGYPTHEKDEVLKTYRRLIPVKTVPRQVLNWDEVREMEASGLVRFGAHTVNHEILDHIPLNDARDEIVSSLAELKRQLHCTNVAFAYPNGNHNEDIRKIVEASGFKAAVTTRKGLLLRDSGISEIPRIGMHEDISSSIPLFRSRILMKGF